MKNSKIFTLLYLVLFLSGCSSKDDILPLTGHVVGFVKLTDEFGKEVTDKSGVTVSLDDTEITAVTNENGRVELPDAPAGTYNVIYSKEGYGTFKQFSFQHVGGHVPALLPEATLYQVPTTELQSMDITFGINYFDIVGNITETEEMALRVFMNDSANVSDTHYDYSPTAQGYIGTPLTQFQHSVNLPGSPYSVGDDVYMIIYFYNRHQTGYIDWETNRYVISTYKKATEVIHLTIQ